MALIEVDEEEYRVSAAARALMDKMANKPGQREKLLRLVKETSPEMHIPEIDAADPLRNEMARIREELGGEVKALKEARENDANMGKLTQRIENERAKLRKQGWDDEGIARIEERIQKDGFVNYAAAAALVEKEDVKPESATSNSYGDNGWNFFAPGNQEEESGYKDLLAGPNGWKKFQNMEVTKFFADKKAGRPL